MIDSWFAGDTQTALQWHLKLTPLFKGIFVTASPVPIKYLLKYQGINAGGVRLPLVDAVETEKKITYRPYLYCDGSNICNWL